MHRSHRNNPSTFITNALLRLFTKFITTSSSFSHLLHLPIYRFDNVCINSCYGKLCLTLCKKFLFANSLLAYWLLGWIYITGGVY